MIEAAEAASNFVSGRSRADLESNQMLVFALVRAIEIVGEAASKVSAATRQSSSDVPWTLIVSMRNRVVHAYFDIDREIVWQTCNAGAAATAADASRFGKRVKSDHPIFTARRVAPAAGQSIS
ncbi:MAG TPA: HepT-like ribonuclease domain-containing protein [Stellaceae bacterium]|nr:HepT-like ribonuclease domain-containing protein [Stellaceae bacterium]